MRANVVFRNILVIAATLALGLGLASFSSPANAMHPEGVLNEHWDGFAIKGYDAVAYFERRMIPSVNFLREPRLQLDSYAAGDHYNEHGRQLLTRLVAEALLELDLGEEPDSSRIAAHEPSMNR